VLPSKSIFGRGDLDKMPFQQYAKYVGAQGKSINTLVTELRLDSDSDTPKLTFKPVKYLSEQEWEVAKEKGGKVTTIDLFKLSDSSNFLDSFHQQHDIKSQGRSFVAQRPTRQPGKKRTEFC
jgi:hypothetical protein